MTSPRDRASGTRPRVLIAGISTRAAAESAALAGYEVTALDAFGDLDQHPMVRALALPRDFGVQFTARAAARAARSVHCDAVAYQSTFENHPAAVRTLGEGRTLWGNPPEVVARVRDPARLARTLELRGLATPMVRERRDAAEETDRRSLWLMKARASGGGNGVREWRLGTPIARGDYVQERIEGVPGSVVFVAAGGRAVPLGISRQLIGDEAFGASGWRYCGSILAGAGDVQFADDESLAASACSLAQVVAESFGLIGINGVDFVARDGVPYAIEVNPRYSASMELVERLHGFSIFGAHADACVSGVLPDFDFESARRGAHAVGKGIVFARREVRVGDTRQWLGDATVRDVPHPGERIPAGRPVCTVFAEGADSASCYAALVRRADAVYGELDSSARVVA